jgi:hypothetical protein
MTKSELLNRMDVESPLDAGPSKVVPFMREPAVPLVAVG